MTKEIKPLTGIRGAAAFVVMLYHFVGYAALTGSTLPSFRKGYLSVDLFFILSGFLLALRYKNHFLANTSWAHYATFLKARMARLYPAYFVIVFLYYAKWLVNISGTNKISYGAPDLAANFLFIQSWGFPVRIIVSDSWSVSVEVFAYLAFPILLFLAAGRNFKIAIGLAFAAIGMLFLIAHTGYGVNGPLDAYRDDNRLWPLLRCLADFSLGLIALRVAQTPIIKKRLSKEFMTAIALLFLIAALIIDRTDVITVVIFAFLIVCLFYNGKISAILFGNRLIHHLGDISYSLYLLHPFFLGVAGHYYGIAQTRFDLSAPTLFIAMGIAATWGTAYLSYRFIEVPGRRYINKISGRWMSEA